MFLAGGAVATPKPSYQASNEADGLEEARLAAEQIVLPLRQPVELLPRVEGVLKAQIRMVERYGLDYEILGSGSDSRLRMLPKNYDVDAVSAPKAPVSTLAK